MFEDTQERLELVKMIAIHIATQSMHIDDTNQYLELIDALVQHSDLPVAICLSPDRLTLLYHIKNFYQWHEAYLLRNTNQPKY